MAEIDYKLLYRRIKKLHNFSFDLRNKLTPQRKSAITRAYKKYTKYLTKLNTGKYDFIPAKKSQLKYLSKQYVTTNRGVIYNRPKSQGTERTVKIVGRGKSTTITERVVIKYANESLSKRGLKKIVFYIRFPEDIISNPYLIGSFIDYVSDKLNPDYISVAINHYSGTQMYDPGNSARYAADLLDTLSLNSDSATEALTGIYIIYYKTGVTKKWQRNVLDVIKSLY